jgi:hypothetical protein
MIQRPGEASSHIYCPALYKDGLNDSSHYATIINNYESHYPPTSNLQIRIAMSSTQYAVDKVRNQSEITSSPMPEL